MATKELTHENFEETVAQDGIVLIDFWASWCGPCRAFAPIFEAASEKHPEVVFGKIDTEAQGELAAMFQVRSIPTIAVFRDGIMLHIQPGMLPPQALDEMIAKVQEIDMDEVREEIAKQQAAEQEETAADAPASTGGA